MPATDENLDDDLAADRRIAEGLQDRLRRDQQTAAAIRAYLLGTRDSARARRNTVRPAARGGS